MLSKLLLYLQESEHDPEGFGYQEREGILEFDERDVRSNFSLATDKKQ